MVQLMPLHSKILSSLASFKSRLVLPFWYQLIQVVLEKRPLNGVIVVIVRLIYINCCDLLYCIGCVYACCNSIYGIYIIKKIDCLHIAQVRTRKSSTITSARRMDTSTSVGRLETCLRLSARLSSTPS